jgi:preprotein translocase subunit SecA
MDYLQEGIHLRAYGQKDPLTEYRREAFGMFEELTGAIEDGFVRYIYRVELVRNDEPARPRPQRVQMTHGDEPAQASGGRSAQATSDKVPRNAPCPCGSGRKYKKCHGAVA